MINWSIIYNDGITISKANSLEKNWNDAPSENVQFVSIWYGHYRRIFSGSNFYNISEPNAVKKSGKLISEQDFQKSREEMYKEKFDENIRQTD